MYDRLIPKHKLLMWVETSRTPEQLRARRRWYYGYIYGATFREMFEWQACHINLEELDDST